MNNVPLFHFNTIETPLDKTKSKAPIYIVKIAVAINTIHVVPIRSFRVGQDTLTNSPLTSWKNTGILDKKFAMVFFHIVADAQLPEAIRTGAAGIEPAVPVLETGGLPLTDAPNLRLTPLARRTKCCLFQTT